MTRERNTLMRYLTTLLVFAVAAGAAAGGEAGFAKKPAAVRAGNKVTISFTLKAPTDAAVEVLGADGKIVRHLGSAALGAENPAQPFKPGLSQTLEWDGKDDTGKPAKGTKVRVRLGLKTEFDRFIGWKGHPPLNNALVNGMAVTPDRNVYVMGSSHDEPRAARSENRVWVMSKEGKYVKTVYPPSAADDPATFRGVDFLSDKKNRLKPRIYDRICISTFPQMRAVTRQTMSVTSDGRLVFFSGWGTELYSFGPRAILVMKTDGSIPRERIDGPNFGPGTASGVRAGHAHLALSPDGKKAYVCGMNTSRYGKHENVVYRAGLGVGDKPEVIFGKPGQPGAGKTGLNEPRGIGVDGKGRVYVSDFGNHRVVVLEPDGKYAGEIPVKGPGVMSVHPKTGAVYVISMPEPKKVYKLVKIASFENPKVLAELDLTKYGGVTSRKTHVGYHPVMTIDPYGPKPVVYLASPAVYCRFRILRVTDEGAVLKDEAIDLRTKAGLKASPYPIGTNSKGDLFFSSYRSSLAIGSVINSRKYSANTGKIEPISKHVKGIAGKDGLFYHGKYQGKSVRRVDESGKVVPFSATGEWSEPYNDWRFYDRRSSWHVQPSGNIYAFAAFVKEKPFSGKVVHLGPDGKIKRKDVIVGLQGAASLRVDSYGNIFVADGFNRDGQPYPPEIDAFAKRLRAKGTNKRYVHSEAVEDVYGEAYGSILKFGPKGGKIRLLAGGEKARDDEILISPYLQRVKLAAKGVKGMYPRISPMAPPRGLKGGVSACWCLFAIYDLDTHNRLFVPDAMQFCVRVVDANFNEIMKFGNYDRATMKGGKANAPGPEIPFEFPTYVSASDDAVYVTDTASCARRIVRVKLGYAAEDTCDIR